MHRRLFLPGPTEVEPDVLRAQAKMMIGHRPADFTKLYTGIMSKLKDYFEIEEQLPIITTSSGTMFMDIVARNLVKKKVLCVTCGAFSERMANAIEGCGGKEVDRLSVEWGKANTVDTIMEKLATDDYDTITVVHNETSTGVRNPIYKIGKKVKEKYPDIMYAIDSVSGMAGDKVLPEKIQSDLIFASTQKAFALPPGLAIAFVSDAAIERAKSLEGRGFYTDLVRIVDYWNRKNQTPSTPAISTLYALDYQLDKMLEEGHEARYQRHKDMAEYTRNWAKKHGFEIFSQSGYESVTVTTITNTHGKNVADLNKKLSKRGFIISNGYGSKLKEKTFRIGHMGDWTLPELKEVLWHIEEIWEL